MKTSIVFVLLLIAAQAHGVVLNGIAKNARRHGNLGKRQVIPSVIPTPAPSSTPTPPASTPSSNTPSSSTPPVSSVSSPSPTTPDSSSATYSPTQAQDSTTAPAPASSVTDSQSGNISPSVVTYVTSVSGSLITGKSTKYHSTITTSTDSDSSTKTTSASPTGSSSPSSSSSSPSTAIIVTAIVASIVVVFGFVLITVRLFKRNKRLDRRTKALAEEVERNHAPDPSSFGGHGPAGPSVTQHQFIPPSEYTEETPYRAAEYDPEPYYQPSQPQQYSDLYPLPSSPPQQHPQPPFVSPPAHDPYTQRYYEGPGYEPKNDGDILYAKAPSSPSMPPYVGADPNQYKPDETYDNVAAENVRKPDVVDF